MNDSDRYIQQFDESFFNDGYNLCDAFLFNGFTSENLFAAQRRLYMVIDELIATFLVRATREETPSECKMGCSYCCQQTVLASPYELFFLADFVKKKFRDDALQTIIQRAEDKKMATSVLNLSRLLKYKQPCPFLHPTGGYCRVYQARPMACRIYLSKSVKSCEMDLKNPEDDTIFPALFDMPLRAGRMLNEGFHARLRKGMEDKIQAFENTIEEGFLKAIEKGAFEKWKEGEKVFRKIN